MQWDNEGKSRYATFFRVYGSLHFPKDIAKQSPGGFRGVRIVDYREQGPTIPTDVRDMFDYLSVTCTPRQRTFFLLRCHGLTWNEIARAIRVKGKGQLTMARIAVIYDQALRKIRSRLPSLERTTRARK